jgi:hypothetical protein
MSPRFFDKLKQVFENKEPVSTEKPKLEFELERSSFEMPEPEKYDLYYLDSSSKRKMTICNLFMNHRKTIPEIASLLEVSRKQVIDALMENKVLKDRRKKSISVEEDHRQG